MFLGKFPLVEGQIQTAVERFSGCHLSEAGCWVKRAELLQPYTAWPQVGSGLRSWQSNSLRQCLWPAICLKGLHPHVIMLAWVSVHVRTYITARERHFQSFLTCSESKLGRSWQGVGAACQAPRTREVVKHKHFGVYPRDLRGVAAEGCTSAVALPLPPAARARGQRGAVRLSVAVCLSVPALPRLSTTVLGALRPRDVGVFDRWLRSRSASPPLPCAKVKADLLDT